MWDEAVDDQSALKFVLDWFVTSKMIKNLPTTLDADNNILHFNKDSGGAVFSCNELGILRKDLFNINLHNTDDDEDNLETIIHRRL